MGAAVELELCVTRRLRLPFLLAATARTQKRLEPLDAEKTLNPTFAARTSTWLICSACVLIYLGISQESAFTWDTVERWGYYSPEAVRAGAYWGYITGVFVHLQFWHLVFNLYWLWRFGTRIITVVGLCQWILLFVSLAFVSSGFQLLLTGKTAFGASGIVYGYLGFLWAARSRYSEFQKVLSTHTLVYFLFWLALCFIITALHIWEVANAAHMFGLGFGALCGAHLNSRRLWNAFALAEALAIALAALPLLAPLAHLATNARLSTRVEHRLDTSTKSSIH